MKLLRLRHDYQEAAAQLEGQFPDPAHATQSIEQDTHVTAHDGSTIAVFLSQRIDPELYRLAHALWKPVKGVPSNRATAVGVKSLHTSMNRYGVPSPRSGVPRVVLDVLKSKGVGQGILGFSRVPRQKAKLTRTTLTIRSPEMLDVNRPLVKLVNRLYKYYLPDLYAKQRTVVKKIPHLRQTAFSTIYVVKNWQTAYHADGNLPGGMTAIMCMGAFTGGALVLPRWRIAFAYEPGDLLLFDAEELHGNLPFAGERMSAAFYCTRYIPDCSR
jgi:hypothetical protein